MRNQLVLNANFTRQTVLLLIIIFFTLSGCEIKKISPPAAPPVQQRLLDFPLSKSSVFLELVAGENIPSFLDDLDQDSLNLAIERDLQYLSKFREDSIAYFGNRQATVKEMKETLLAFRNIMAGPETNEVKEKKIKDGFDFYQSIGSDGKGLVLFTGYYEPLLEGSYTKTERYRYPLYRMPEDTIVINLGRFNEKYGTELLVGRLSKGEVAPYYTRADIDGKGILAGRNLEILWVDNPIDLFFLHIQGSGRIRLPDGSLIQAGYAQSNGRPFRGVTGYLLEKGKITPAEQSMQSVRKYLVEHPEEMSEILNRNERYIFFRIVENGPLGALNTTITGGRTIASDLDLFPRGALALITAKKPVIEKGDIVSWQPFTRFVLNQDTGNAIKGPGRIDLFCGSGEEAAAVAGRLKEAGTLLFLIKK